MALEHKHDHGPDCTCGCHDHGHDHDGHDGHGHNGHGHHHHDHGHGHGHGHHHDHGYEETLQLDAATVRLEAHTHEQTATVSATFSLFEGGHLPFGNVVACMQQIAAAVEDAGGIVGHIKGYAKQGDAFAHASVTAAGLEPTCEGDMDLEIGPDAVVQLAAIALLIDQDDLLAICKTAIANS